MSEKKEKANTQVTPATPEMELSIDIVSNNGSVGKTILAIILAEYFKRQGEVALFTLDNNNQELANVFGNRVNGKLVAPEFDDPMTGVGYYDYRTNADEGVRTLRKFKGKHVLRDNPADSIDAQCAMGDFSKQVKSYKGMNKKIVYFVMGSSTKCPKSFTSLNDLLKSSENVDMSNIEIVPVLNIGMLKQNRQLEAFSISYNESKDVKELKATGKFHELEINTGLEEADIAAMKKYKLDQILELEETMAEDENGNLIVDYLMRQNIASIYEEVFAQLDKLMPILRK